MYKIKGQDQKEYGPVEAAQLRQWITEGRATAQSLIQPEGTAEWRPLGSFPEFAGAAPPPIASLPAALPPDNTLATVIPYKNMPALLAYYMGIFSLIPCLGLFLGIAGFILGIIGLKRARQYPEAKGKVHAWIGIIVGGFFGLLYLVLAVIMAVAAARAKRY